MPKVMPLNKSKKVARREAEGCGSRETGEKQMFPAAGMGRKS